jgi:hypothetical protein
VTGADFENQFSFFKFFKSMQILANLCRSLQILPNPTKSLQTLQILEVQIHVDLCKSMQILRIRSKTVQILPKPKKIKKSTPESAQDPRESFCAVWRGAVVSLLSVCVQILANPFKLLQIRANP